MSPTRNPKTFALGFLETAGAGAADDAGDDPDTGLDEDCEGDRAGEEDEEEDGDGECAFAAFAPGEKNGNAEENEEAGLEE